MQYTIRNIPRSLDRALRLKSRKEGKTLDQVVIEMLERGLQANERPAKFRDLDDLAGTWVEDPQFDRAIAEQDQIHPDDWKEIWSDPRSQDRSQQ